MIEVEIELPRYIQKRSLKSKHEVYGLLTLISGYWYKIPDLVLISDELLKIFNGLFHVQ
jgi:hypothetical protein